MEGTLLIRFLFVSVLLSAGVLSGCGGKRMAGPPLPARSFHGHVGTGGILEAESGRRISFDELINGLSEKDIVFIGEVHDNPDHHLIQTQILQALLDRWGKDAAVGMEFFPSTAQETLNRYIQGELVESEFLSTVKWEKIWGYDYHLYRPLMLSAKQRSIEVLGINVAPDVVKKVAREGLSSLTPHEREQIPREMDLENAGHREFLHNVFQEHAHADVGGFENFYAAQVVWDETMAENIASHLKTRGGKMVVFTGIGHIIHKFGIPDRTMKRIPVPAATVIPYSSAGEEEIRSGFADYVWLTTGHP